MMKNRLSLSAATILLGAAVASCGGELPAEFDSTQGEITIPTFPAASGTQNVTSTIKVSGTFDGKMKRYQGASGSQSESQKPIFELAAGSTIQNVIIGNLGQDGIHCTGTCTLRNVWWEDVGEDAATLKGSSSSQTMTIDGGGARSASDKVFQHNGPGTMVIQNFFADSFGKLYRSCGNCSKQYKRTVIIRNVIARGGKVLAGVNANYGDSATFTNINVVGNSPTICERYTGNTSGAEPTKIGSGIAPPYCNYTNAEIHKS
jgi:pectate lyase